jgi:hypothetical protein
MKSLPCIGSEIPQGVVEVKEKMFVTAHGV